MTFAQLTDAVLRRLAETPSAPISFTRAEVQTALNDGLAELADASEWYETYRTIDLLDTRPYYDARDVLGDDVLTIGAAYNDQTSRWLIPSAIRELDGHDDQWESVVGEPERLIQRGLWWLGYWPRIGSDAGTVKQYFTALPANLDEDLDEPGFPDALHEGAIEFALADLWAQSGEATNAVNAWTRYEAYEAALTAWVQHRAAVPMVKGHAQSGDLAH